MRKFNSYCVLTLMLGILAGCGNDGYADLDAYMSEVRSRPAGRIEPMPKDVIYEPFTYQAASLRSPFQPPIKLELAQKARGTSGVKPDETRVREFLESFGIESFTMVGTLANSSEGSYALVSGGGGVHRVRVGDYMGRNHGRITGISAATIEVIELVPDGDGGWIERPRTLVLRERS